MLKQPSMKLLKGIAGVCMLIGAMNLQAATATYTGITSASEIGLSLDDYTVIKAVNVGGTSSDTVNGITFEADQNVPTTGAAEFSGNGYTGFGNEEGSDGVPDAAFTQITLNIGAAGYLNGTAFTGLTTNQNYVFDLYLSDDNAGRGFLFSYKIGTADWVELDPYYQTLGPVNLLRLSFNMGSATTFDWTSVSTEDYHDSKTSGYVLYESNAAVPEPSSIALLGLAAFAGCSYLVRRKKA